MTSQSKHRLSRSYLNINVQTKKSRPRLVSTVDTAMPTIFTEGRLDMVLIEASSRSLSWSCLDQKVSILIGLDSVDTSMPTIFTEGRLD